MDRLGFTAMTAARRTELSMQVHANNLANVNTTGFRADLEQSEAAEVTGFGYDSRHMALVKGNGVDLTPGPLIQTGRSLDIGIKGSGLIALSAGDGEAYTRNGNLQLDAESRLTTNGYPVLGESGPITLPDFDGVHIGNDGVISIVARGDTRMTEIDRIKLVDISAAELKKNAEGLLVLENGDIADISENVNLASGFLEDSNVSVIQELVTSMSLNRLFEAQVKMMKAAEDISNAGNRLIRGG